MRYCIWEGKIPHAITAVRGGDFVILDDHLSQSRTIISRDGNSKAGSKTKTLVQEKIVKST